MQLNDAVKWFYDCKLETEWLNAILKWNIKVRLNILCYLTMYGALFAAYMLCVYSRGWVFSLLVHLARCGELLPFSGRASRMT